MIQRLLLALVVCLPSVWAQMRLSAQATQAGYRLTTFADNFPQAFGIGPIGIAFSDSGGVLVSDHPGNIRRFPNRNDNQRANTAPVTADFGVRSGGGLAKSGGRIYAGDQLQGRLLLLNDNGTLNQVVVASGLTNCAGLATHPLNGHIFISVRDAGVPDRIVDFDPATRSFTTFKSGVSADGLAFSQDGAILYAALLDSSRVVGYRLPDGAQAFETGVITGADGVAVGTGVLSGQLFVNTTDGRVVQVDLATRAQTVLAAGGSRGDLVAVDHNDGSLLLTQSDRILRLIPPAGAAFGGSGDGQLLTNGSFEFGGFGGCNNGSYCRVARGGGEIVGWQVGGEGVDWHNNTEMQNPRNGQFVIDLHTEGRIGSQGTLSQTFATIPGQRYVLTFFFAGPGLDPELRNPRQIMVSVAGVQQTFSTPASSNLSIQWSQQTLNFTASAVLTTLTFSSPAVGQGYWGPVLDDVSVLALTGNTPAPTPTPPPTSQLTLTSQGAQAGFRLTTFADSFPSAPLGIAFPASGGVLVTEGAGRVRRFPTNADGQRASAITPALNTGERSTAGLAKAGGIVYMGDALASRLLQLNDSGTINQVVVANNLPSPYGMATNPRNQHLFVSCRYGSDQDKIVDVDFAARTASLFKVNLPADGLAFSADGATLYAAIYDERPGAAKHPDDGHIQGFRLADAAKVFDSGFISGNPDGLAVGAGALAGLLFANTNDGRVIQIDLRTNAQVVIASGGSRGDLVAVDPNDGSLLLTQTDRILRLIPPAGGSFGGEATTPTPTPPQATGTVLTSSNWDNAADGVDGWTFLNDGTNLQRVAAGGNPGGFLQVTDRNTGDTIYWVAPAKFLGNKSSAYRGALAFDLQQSTPGNQFDEADVVLLGGGLTLVFNTPTNPATAPAWRSYSVPLLASAGWRVGSLSGAAATEAQLQAALANLTALRIRAEFSSAVDVNGLDNVVLTATSDSVLITSVGNGADFSPAVAPGSLASVFGVGLAAANGQPSSVPFPTTFNGTTVTVNGRPAPITFVSPGQINFQMPAATPVGTATITVASNSQTSAPFTFAVSATAPGIFQYGVNRAIVQNQNGSLNDQTNPAATGSAVVVYLTGIGLTTPAVGDGAVAPGGPLAVPTGVRTATVGGANAQLIFLGLTPGNVGLAQANLLIPNLPTGDYPLVLTVDGRSSRAARVAVVNTGGGGGNPGGGSAPVGGLPEGAKCVSGPVESVTFSREKSASRQADEIVIGGTKLCATCEFKTPVYGDFAQKLQLAREDSLDADVCFDTVGTMNYLRLRSTGR